MEDQNEFVVGYQGVEPPTMPGSKELDCAICHEPAWYSPASQHRILQSGTKPVCMACISDLMRRLRHDGAGF